MNQELDGEDLEEQQGQYANARLNHGAWGYEDEKRWPRVKKQEMEKPIGSEIGEQFRKLVEESAKLKKKEREREKEEMKQKQAWEEELPPPPQRRQMLVVHNDGEEPLEDRSAGHVNVQE